MFNRDALSQYEEYSRWNQKPRVVRQSIQVDLRPLMPGRYADPDCMSRLKIQVEKPDEGKWAGWIFVADAAVYGRGCQYGMQSPHTFYKGQIQDMLLRVLHDPKSAMVAYGKLTGTCAVCGRPLEDAQSLARGIGPVCAKRVGL